MKMTKLFILSLLTIGLVSSLSTELNSQVQALIQENANFKSNLDQMIQMSIASQSSGQKSSIVLDLMDDLKKSLETEQKRDDNTYIKEKAILEALILKINKRMTWIDNRLIEIETLIAPIQKKIKALKRRLRVITEAIKLVQTKQSELEKLRKLDLETHKDNLNRQSQMYKAIKYLIVQVNKLQETNDKTEFLEVKQVVMNMIEQLPVSSPIRAFIALTSTFDKDTLNQISTKLSQIEEALDKSIADGVLKENQAVQKYTSLKAEMIMSIAEFNKEKKPIKEKITKLEAKIAALLKEKKELKAELIKLEAQLKQAQIDLANLTTVYNKRKTIRSKNIQYTKQAKEQVQYADKQSETQV